jgi:hypothetical protein
MASLIFLPVVHFDRPAVRAAFSYSIEVCRKPAQTTCPNSDVFRSTLAKTASITLRGAPKAQLAVPIHALASASFNEVVSILLQPRVAVTLLTYPRSWRCA